jgi:hypothetical protein
LQLWLCWELQKDETKILAVYWELQKDETKILGALLFDETTVEKLQFFLETFVQRPPTSCGL